MEPVAGMEGKWASGAAGRQGTLPAMKPRLTCVPGKLFAAPRRLEGVCVWVKLAHLLSGWMPEVKRSSRELGKAQGEEFIFSQCRETERVCG